MNINTNITFSTLKKLVTTNLTFKLNTKHYTLHKCSINFTHKFINYITKPEPRIKTIKPKKYDDSYAGNPNNNPESEIKPIYKYTTKNKYDYYYFNNNHIIISETLPTQEQINLLTYENITLIYTPHQDSVIIRHLQDRQQYFKTYNPETHRYEEDPTKPLTRNYIFNQLLASKLLTATIYFTDYNNTDNYYTSFQHLIKQLAIHKIRTKFTDTQNYYTINIHEDTFSASHDFIQPHDMEQYNNIMRPYHAYLSQLTHIKPEPHTLSDTLQQAIYYFLDRYIPIDHTNPNNAHIQFRNYISASPESKSPEQLLTYLRTWAPAYDITIDTDLCTYDKLHTYLLLKYYELTDIPINDDYTICPHCNKPYSMSLIHNDLPCPHCEQLDQETLDELYQDYTADYTWPNYQHHPVPETIEPHVQPTQYKRPTYLDKPLNLPAFNYELCDIYQPLWTAIATNELSEPTRV